MKLSTIQSNNSYTVANVIESELKHRLYEMGIFPNQELELVNRAPLGDPMVVQVDGQLIMLRLSEAELIVMEEN